MRWEGRGGRLRGGRLPIPVSLPQDVGRQLFEGEGPLVSQP